MGAALATGRPDAPGGGVDASGAGRETRYVAAAPPEIPPMRTPTRRSAAARPPLTPDLPARRPRCFSVRRPRGRLAASSGRANSVGLDHLTDGRGAHLEVHVRVRLDGHVP